jgi:hypothetical protein
VQRYPKLRQGILIVEFAPFLARFKASASRSSSGSASK